MTDLRRMGGRCETTLTDRYAVDECNCATYPDNLGPCITFTEGDNGNCAYCDHNELCHSRVWPIEEQDRRTRAWPTGEKANE